MFGTALLDRQIFFLSLTNALSSKCCAHKLESGFNSDSERFDAISQSNRFSPDLGKL